jgi:hypothetical protein
LHSLLHVDCRSSRRGGSTSSSAISMSPRWTRSASHVCVMIQCSNITSTALALFCCCRSSRRGASTSSSAI